MKNTYEAAKLIDMGTFTSQTLGSGTGSTNESSHANGHAETGADSD